MMRAPTVDRLRSVLGLDPERAQLVRALLTRALPFLDGDHAWAMPYYEWPEEDQARFPRTHAWVRSCYNPPHWTEVALSCVDETIGTCGVEGWASRDNYRDGVSYCNTGDTYAATVVLISDSGGRRWYLGSWGDLAERGVCGA